ncbi:MAG: patatin-like phospholipase family protein [Candidatus Dormibacteria bacterium]
MPPSRTQARNRPRNNPGGDAGKTVFILAGGAARGAYQAGALLCLEEMGIRPDVIIGSSIGVINACLYATGGAHLVAETWLDFDQPLSVFALDPLRNAVLGNSLFIQDRLAEAIERSIDFRKVLRSKIDVHFVTTNFTRGYEEFMGNRTCRTADDLRRASRIGYTIPILYPPVKVGTDYYVDGGFAWNVPFEYAVEMGATRLFVLSCIPRELPVREEFPNLIAVWERLYDLLWRTAGNASLLFKKIEMGEYQGVEVHILEPDYLEGFSPLALLMITGEKSRRYLDQGYYDARRAMRGYPMLRENTGERGR